MYALGEKVAQTVSSPSMCAFILFMVIKSYKFSIRVIYLMFITKQWRLTLSGNNVCQNVASVVTEVMDQVAENVPPLEKIVAEIEELATSGGKYHEVPHVIEVTLPMLCR